MTKMRGVALMVAIAVAALTYSARAGGPSLEVVANWGGAVNAVFVDPAAPDIAYIGSGRRLVILNVANPAAVTEIGAIDLASIVYDIQVRNGYAYVASPSSPSPNNFCVVNVQNPATPQLVWHATSPPFFVGGAEEVDLYGNFAYVRTGANDIECFEITNPLLPVYRGRVYYSWAGAVAIVGTHMYIAKIGAPPPPRLEILDLANPIQPASLSEVTLANPSWHRPTQIDVKGNYAFITTPGSIPPDEATLAIVDISNPNAPSQLSTETFKWANDVTVVGDYAYVADMFPRGASIPIDQHQEVGLAIMDITNPSAPVMAASYRTHGSVTGVEVFGTRAYLMDEGEGLIILDITNPLAPVRLGGYHSPAALHHVVKNGNLLYVCDQFNGFTILNVANPQQPVVVGIHQTPEGATHNWSIDYHDDRVYLSEDTFGFEIVDVSNPSNPERLGSFSPWPQGVHAVGLELNPSTNILHVGTWACCAVAHLVNFDVSDPERVLNPGFVFLGSDNHVFRVILTADGQTAHVVRPGGAQAVNVANPSSPFLLSGSAPNFARDVALNGSLRLVGIDTNNSPGQGGLHVQDVTDPANPVQLSYVPSETTTGVTVQDNLAYMTTHPQTSVSQLRVLDISKPAAPTTIAQTEIGRHGLVYADGPYIYLTDARDSGIAGLTILRLNGVQPCPADIAPPAPGGDGTVNILDLLFVVANWGQGPGNPADVNNDNIVNLADLLFVISNWGPCT